MRTFFTRVALWRFTTSLCPYNSEILLLPVRSALSHTAAMFLTF